MAPKQVQTAKAKPAVAATPTTKSAPTSTTRSPTNGPTPQSLDGGVKLPLSKPKPDDDCSTAQPTKSKRKPRKLNRAPVEQAAASTPAETLNREIEVLKTRMRELEGQVEALYSQTTNNDAKMNAPAPAKQAPKLPRRRGRGRGSPLPGSENRVQKLEEELKATQKELDGLRLRQKIDSKTMDGEDPDQATRNQSTSAPRVAFTDPLEAEEEIPRSAKPAIEQRMGSHRSVTLTGNYRIPLPATVSMDDVRTIQNGISSANRIAREIVDAKRSQRAAEVPSSVIRPNESAKQSWGDWIGGYSMSLARFVNNIEADAAVEQAPGAQTIRPSAGSRRRSVPNDSGTGAHILPKSALKRPQAGKERSLSQEQVDTLMA